MTKSVKFEIDFGFDVLCRLFDTNTVSTGMTKEVPGGAVIQLGGMPMQKRHLTQDAAPLVTIAVSLASGVALNLFSSWLYDKLKDSKIRRLKINRRDVEISANGILRAIEETIEIEHEK
jgi:hypothetical protein